MENSQEIKKPKTVISAYRVERETIVKIHDFDAFKKFFKDNWDESEEKNYIRE